MTKEERKTLRMVAGTIGDQCRAIAESAEGHKALKLLSTIRHGLGVYLAQEDLSLPLFPDEKAKGFQDTE